MRKYQFSLIARFSFFNLPIKKTRDGIYKVPSGSTLMVCMTSDFFLEEADEWRQEVWNMIKTRQDVTFWLQTKRAERVKDNLPTDWVKKLYDECVKYNVNFDFCGTGNVFIRDGKTYNIPKAYQKVMALKSELQNPLVYKQEDIKIQPRCKTCKRRDSCNGCSWCGRCK